ncbi:MAG: hypothetical protein ABJP34_02940 [Erythrobacter sp.]
MRATLALAALATFGLSTPAFAQDSGGEKVNMVIAYGDDECPKPVGDEIIVCEILVEAERFRIPSNLRTSRSLENRSWAERVESLKVIGEFGTASCSPTGSGALVGCTQKMIDAAYAEKRAGAGVRFAQLIEAARAERLSTIDEDAAEQQARVEKLEQAYLDRLERERDAPLPGDGVSDEISDATAEAPRDTAPLAQPPQ